MVAGASGTGFVKSMGVALPTNVGGGRLTNDAEEALDGRYAPGATFTGVAPGVYLRNSIVDFVLTITGTFIVTFTEELAIETPPVVSWAELTIWSPCAGAAIAFCGMRNAVTSASAMAVPLKAVILSGIRMHECGFQAAAARANPRSSRRTAGADSMLEKRSCIVINNLPYGLTVTW
jgi:hypothetical protein